MLFAGAGGLAAQLFDDLEAMKFDDVVFWSEVKTKYNFISEKYKILSTDEEVKEYFKNVSKDFAICVGDTNTRKKIAEKFRNLGGEITSVISPFSAVSKYANIGKGTMILRDCNVEAGATIGEECLVNKLANIGHDCVISSYCEIGPQALISADTFIGENSLIGIGAIILPKVKVGQNVTVAAGSVATKNIPDNAVFSGVAAELRFFKKIK